VTVLSGEGTHQVLYSSTDIHTGMRRNRGFIARPDHAGSFRTVIVAHDVWGIGGYLKDLAWRLARHGFAVVIPDLYRGRLAPGRSREEANGAFASIGDPWQTLEDVYEFVRSSDTPWSLPGWLGLLGVGAGSEPALEFVGRHGADAIALIAGAGFDRLPPGLPALAIHGKSDEVSPLPSPLSDRLQWVLYAGAGHDFLNDHGPEYADGPARDAVGRLVTFLGEA
jgi:carboxymethylenebutenolidase